MSDLFIPSESLQVQPGSGLSTQVPAIGAEVGSALSQVGQVQTRIYRDHNAIATMAAQNDLSAWTNEALFHPQNGVLHQESGVNAPKVVDKTLSDYQAQVSKISAGLTNQDQKSSFAMAAAEHEQAVKRQLYGYEHEQVTKYTAQQTDAFIKNSQNAAVQHLFVAGPPSVGQAEETKQSVSDEVAKQQAAVADLGRMQGLPPEAIKAQQQQVASDTHMMVLEQLFASGHNATAKEWFQQHEDQFQGKDKIRASNMVRVGTDQDQARAAADSILAGMHKDALDDNGTLDRSKITEESALARIEEVGKGMDTGVYDQMKSRVLQTLRMERDAHNEVQTNTMQDLYDAMNDPNNFTHELPANKLATLDRPKQITMLREQAQARKGDEPQTVPEVWQDIMDKSTDQNQWDDFLKTKPVEYRPYLSKTDFARLETRYADVSGRVAKRDTTLSQGMVTDQAIDKLWTDNIGTFPKKAPAGEVQSAEYNDAMARKLRFSTQLHSVVAAEQLKLKRELTPPEVTEQANKLFATQTWQTPGAPSVGQFFTSPLLIARGLINRGTTTGPAFEAPYADKLVYRAEAIPVATRALMLKHDQARGTSRTNDEMVQDYNDSIARDYELRRTLESTKP